MDGYDSNWDLLEHGKVYKSVLFIPQPYVPSVYRLSVYITPNIWENIMDVIVRGVECQR